MATIPTLTPSTPTFSRSSFRSGSPSPSPSRPRIFDDVLANISPRAALDALTSSDSLQSRIDTADPVERAFGLNAVGAAVKIEDWYIELSGWKWPSESGFEPPSKRRKISQDVPLEPFRGRKGNDLTSATRHPEPPDDEDVQYWGSLPSTVVIEYEGRVDDIQVQLDNLKVEELKHRILEAHLAISRPTTPIQGPAIQHLMPRMNDFTAIVTAAFLKALPYLSRLIRLLDIWSARLSVLRLVPALVKAFEDVELALDSAWRSLKVTDDDRSTISRETYTVIRDVLQYKVAATGRKIDMMLDLLEGRDDILPEHWLDRTESIERQYAEWAFRGQRKVLEGELRPVIIEKPLVRGEAMVSLTDNKLPTTGDSTDAIAIANTKSASSSSLKTIHPPQIQESEPTPSCSTIQASNLADKPSDSTHDSDISREVAQALPEDVCANAGKSQGDTESTLMEQQNEPEVTKQSHPPAVPVQVDSTEPRPIFPTTSAVSEVENLISQLQIGEVPPVTLIPSHIPVSGTALDTKNRAIEDIEIIRDSDHGNLHSESIEPSHLAVLEACTTVGHEEVDVAPYGTTSPTKELPSIYPQLDVQDQSSEDYLIPLGISLLSPVTEEGSEHEFSLFGGDGVLPRSSLDVKVESSCSPVQEESIGIEQNAATIESSTLVAEPALTASDESSSVVGSSASVDANARVASMEHSEPLKDSSLDSSEATEQKKLHSDPVELPSSLDDQSTPVLQSVFPRLPPLTTTTNDTRSPTGGSDPASSTKSTNSPLRSSRSSSVSSNVGASEFRGRPRSGTALSMRAEFFEQSNRSSPTSQSRHSSYSSRSASPEIRTARPNGFVKAAIGLINATEKLSDPAQARIPSAARRFSAPMYPSPAVSRNISRSRESSISSTADRTPTAQRERASSSPSQQPALTSKPAITLSVGSPRQRYRSPSQPIAVSRTPSPSMGMLDRSRSPSIEPMDLSPSFRRATMRPSLPQLRPPSADPSHYDTDTFDTESNFSLDFSEAPVFENVDVASISSSSPVMSSQEHFQKQISQILAKVPAKITLTSEAESRAALHSRKVRPQNPRPKPPSRAVTPSFTLAPAYAKQPRQRPQNGNPEIKVYHLSRSNGEAPIKLFVRLVGEGGERVMVRVGGGWADLGEYLKEYALHHARKPGPDDKSESQDHQQRVSSMGSMSLRNSRSASPMLVDSPFDRPRSSLSRPKSSLNIRKTRQPSHGDANVSRPSPIPFASGSREPDSPRSLRTAASRSSLRSNWGDDDGTLGMAGPRSKKVEISAEDQAWVESMKERVRQASVEHDPGVQRQFGDMGKVGSTKRLFKKAA